MKKFPDYDRYDALGLAELIRKTGVVILGKTNTPEFTLIGVTEPELNGPTRNPWNLDVTPDGSSGGAKRYGRKADRHPNSPYTTVDHRSL